MESPDNPDTVSDDFLRLVFTCCHPEVSRDNQIAITSKVVAGFETEEIARAFACSEDTVSQRILRARQTIEGEAAVIRDPGARRAGGARLGCAPPSK